MWDVKVTLDPDKTKDGDIVGVADGIPPMGDITATWTDESGVFTFGARSPVDEAGKADFMKLAIEAHKAWKKREVATEVVEDVIKDQINATDTLK